MKYDIVGDIHGQADKLEALLTKLGYRKTGAVWHHLGRQAIFVGDFIDRGPAQIRCVETVRRMVEAGTALAVMGNHELNAIAWHTPDPDQAGEYLRPHFRSDRGAKNRRQHQAFLAEVEHDPQLHADIIEWFLTLPLWLDLPELRVVHACWHTRFMEWMSPRLNRGRYLTRDLMSQATKRPQETTGTPTIFQAVEALTKGIEIPLPAGHYFVDKDGTHRDEVRIRWWDEKATTYRLAAMLPAAQRAALPDLPIPEYARVPAGEKPVFFGHYWLTGAPSLQTSQAVCVDYSVGKGGPLVAYRFHGDPHLSDENFVWVE